MNIFRNAGRRIYGLEEASRPDIRLPTNITFEREKYYKLYFKTLTLSFSLSLFTNFIIKAKKYSRNYGGYFSDNSCFFFFLLLFIYFMFVFFVEILNFSKEFYILKPLSLILILFKFFFFFVYNFF